MKSGRNSTTEKSATLGANSSSLTTHFGASSSLANVADRLHLIATNLNTLANKLDTQSPLENVAVQLQKIATKLQ